MSKSIYDYFISYKHSDSSSLAASLQASLTAAGFSVWLDQLQIAPGDSILRSVELGLSSSIDGIIIMSPNYFTGWADQERRALFSKMAAGRIRLVPILHGITAKEVADQAPLFADISSLQASDDSPETAQQLAQKILLGQRPERREMRLFELFFRCILDNRPYDPEIDLFLAVFDGDTDRAKRAVSAGATGTVTDLALFKRYWKDGASCGCFEEWRKLVLHLSETGKISFGHDALKDGA